MFYVTRHGIEVRTSTCRSFSVTSDIGETGEVIHTGVKLYAAVTIRAPHQLCTGKTTQQDGTYGITV